MKWLRGLIVAAFCLAPVGAGAWWQSVQQIAVGGAPAAYQGPGDLGISGAAAFYSCGRAYSAAYAAGAGNLCLIFGTTTTTTCTLKSNVLGFADLTTANCVGNTVSITTFCTVINPVCHIQTMYDQSGALACAGSVACDVTTGTDADRPVWTASALNILPCGASTASVRLVSAATLTIGATTTMAAVANRNASSTSMRLIGNGTNSVFLGASAATNTLRIFAGSSVTSTASDGSYHSLIGVSNNSGSAAMVVDGSTAGQSGTSTGANTQSSNINIFNDGSLTPWAGLVCEASVWSIQMNSTQYGLLDTNMRSSTNGWNF